ncbi:hypothetical protein [Streptomyces sp. MST-110588]|uniref:hypothetical protein n=1 Tax=Streptomyces sp. MST-110588 TaxID=2833628 RepID=UPI001F5C95FA|nr:hypothetical protein [Streptomyces sp. MST-110588]UNO42196.1 hypothetical protein KGS77_25085 [Streptomyces sp. MST-110588]
MAEVPACAGAAGPAEASVPPGRPVVCEELLGTAVLAALEQRFAEGLVPPREPQAVIHPNGFVKLPLAQTDDGAIRLFLHVWRADSIDADVHDHRWPFSSLVLRGEVSHTLTEVTVISGSAGSRSGEKDAKEVFPVVRYRLAGGEHCFDFSHGESAVVDRRRTHVLSAGRRYGMEAFVFHRAHSLAGAMTLVARGVPQQPYSRVLLNDETPVPAMKPWRRLDQDERRRHLRDALEVLR